MKMAYDQREKEFLEDVGRIKFMQQSGTFDPPPLTQPMKKRLKDMGMTYTDIKPVDINGGIKNRYRNGKPKRIYGYYIDGRLIVSGTKKEIEKKAGVKESTLSELIHSRKIRTKGRNRSDKIHFVRRCEE